MIPQLRAAVDTVRLWMTTAFRASPGLAAMMCVSVVLSSVLNPLQVYAIKLVVDAVGAHTSLLSGVVLLGVCLLVTAISGSFAGPIGDTLDEKVYWYVHDDLLRLTAGVPSIAHHEDRRLADRLALIEQDRGQLAGVYRMLSVVGGVTGRSPWWRCSGRCPRHCCSCWGWPSSWPGCRLGAGSSSAS